MTPSAISARQSPNTKGELGQIFQNGRLVRGRAPCSYQEAGRELDVVATSSALLGFATPDDMRHASFRELQRTSKLVQGSPLWRSLAPHDTARAHRRGRPSVQACLASPVPVSQGRLRRRVPTSGPPSVSKLDSSWPSSSP